MNSIDGYKQTLWLITLILAAAVLMSNLDFEVARPGADIEPAFGAMSLESFWDFVPEGKFNIGTGTANLTLSYEGGIARRFEGPVIENMTILDALNSASIGGGFDVRYSFESNGDVNLSVIDGQIANDVKKWHLRLNGLEIDAEDIGRIRIKKYDSIEARFE